MNTDINTDKIELKFHAYSNWLARNSLPKSPIMEGADSTILPYIKTGDVDMASDEWPETDPEIIYIGGYMENRIVGTNDADLATENLRTMHIGLDFFKPAGTKVFAPLSGRVHSFKNNDGGRDYGPCIILQHDFDGLTFYTLYGHLSLDALENLAFGQKINAGQEFARLGSREINGGWPAHLHFQIILDMMGKEGEFYGLCRPEEKEVWQMICPNPMEFLGLKYGTRKGNRATKV